MMSSTKQKILLLLLTGVAFGFTYLPRRQWKILKEVAKEWERIDERKLKEEIGRLYQSKLVEIKENPDQSYTVLLTDRGKFKALTYHFQKMKIEKGEWDGKWRMVVFDVPEKIRKGRDALREKLRELGFYELQKSVFIFPYECRDEIEFIVEFFNMRRYIRFGILESIDNNLHLKKIFELT